MENMNVKMSTNRTKRTPVRLTNTGNDEKSSKTCLKPEEHLITAPRNRYIHRRDARGLRPLALARCVTWWASAAEGGGGGGGWTDGRRLQRAVVTTVSGSDDEGEGEWQDAPLSYWKCQPVNFRARFHSSCAFFTLFCFKRIWLILLSDYLFIVNN